MTIHSVFFTFIQLISLYSSLLTLVSHQKFKTGLDLLFVKCIVHKTWITQWRKYEFFILIGGLYVFTFFATNFSWNSKYVILFVEKLLELLTAQKWCILMSIRPVTILPFALSIHKRSRNEVNLYAETLLCTIFIIQI